MIKVQVNSSENRWKSSAFGKEFVELREAELLVKRGSTEVYDCVWLEHPGRKKNRPTSPGQEEKRAYRLRKAAKVCGVTRVEG